MEETNSNDSACPLMAGFDTATLVSVCRACLKNFFFFFFADVYLLIAPALTGRGRISQ